MTPTALSTLRIPGIRRRIPGLVSAIMPAYNVRPYIADAVESVLSQADAAVELLVIDDGSTDGTAEYLADYAARDSRLQLRTADHGGPNAARNLAIPRARGEYLTFLDGDDLLLPGAYARARAALERSGSDFAVAPYERIVNGVPDPGPAWIRDAHRTARIGVHVEDYPSVLVNAVQWTKVYRRSFWDRSVQRFPTAGFYQDQVVSARAYGASTSIDVLDTVAVGWRSRDDRSSMTQQQATVGNMQDRFRTATESLEILGRTKGADVRNARLVQYLSYDIANTAGYVPGASDEFWNGLVQRLRAFSELVPNRKLWNEVPAQHKVLYELIRRDARAEAEGFIAQKGRTASLFSGDIRENGVFIRLPYWQDERVDLPEWVFRANPRQAKKLRKDATGA